MMVGESDVGRSLLMVFSDGLDTASWLTADRVLDMGRRSDVVVYPITSKGAEAAVPRGARRADGRAPA